ncbi:hypothetical protein HO133_003954 [Letharia lupina]|uniref:Uncharacterized protein n=1 Tax=Letharia lupina TaxID=560253 RepID=A0A8H6F8S2_9LECA|nr:uncharacterized protein HO133_003954 [Letharia lupina]KAF6219487.1 hypothetical protein HO133_003954 [Letharia lupina]
MRLDTVSYLDSLREATETNITSSRYSITEVSIYTCNIAEKEAPESEDSSAIYEKANAEKTAEKTTEKTMEDTAEKSSGNKATIVKNTAQLSTIPRQIITQQAENTTATWPIISACLGNITL